MMSSPPKKIESGQVLSRRTGNNVAGPVARIMDRISEGLMWLGSVLLVIITLLTVSDAFARSFFNLPIQGSIELVQLMLVCIAFSGMVYTTSKKANVQVTLLICRLPERIQMILASTMNMIGAIIFGLLCWQMCAGAIDWLHMGRYSVTLNIPLYPFKFAASVASGLISLFLVRNVIHSLNIRPLN
jgi:TRAP-type C4-dicarboxylate transport system permease small subunit